jgi:hypothetical protein
MAHLGILVYLDRKLVDRGIIGNWKSCLSHNMYFISFNFSEGNLTVKRQVNTFKSFNPTKSL